MGWLAPLALGVSALGGLFGGSKSSRTQSSTPTIDPKYQGLVDALYGKFSSNLDSTVPLEGYEGTGISNINSVYDIAKTTRQNSLTRRGLSTSPVAANMDAVAENSRAGDISTFQNSLPLLQRELQQQDYTNALNLIKSLMGQETVVPGSAAGSTFNNAGSMLGFLLGQGLLGGSN